MGSGSSKPRKKLAKKSSGPALDSVSSNAQSSVMTVTTNRTVSTVGSSVGRTTTSSYTLTPQTTRQSVRQKSLTPLEEHNARYRDHHKVQDTQTGERHDYTDIWHSLAHKASDLSLESIKEAKEEIEIERPPGEAVVSKISPELWREIASYLNPLDAANLALSSRTLLWLVGPEPWQALKLPENKEYKVEFLLPMEEKLPDQLFCFLCAAYHRRIFPGKEALQPAEVLNPVFICPLATDHARPPPRARIVPGHNLPFTFVQLALRTHRFSPSHGIAPSSLARRWKDPDSGWTHRTAYHVYKGHLLMRVVSWKFAQGGLPPSAMRHLLYWKGDYSPFFSVCAHWRDGELMNLCKCALGHIPEHRPTLVHRVAADVRAEMRQGILAERKQLRESANTVVSQCAMCRPARRCIDCPTEYLIELKLTEDVTDPDPRTKFKQAISVTRWSDLGDGRNPTGKEWAAVTHEGPGYDSFKEVGKRTVAGIFESRFGNSQAGQRVLSLNPKGQRKGEAGHNWY